jgi:hypothetical protein
MQLLLPHNHRIPGVKLAGDDIRSHMQADMREFWNDLTIETDIFGYLLTNILGAAEMYGSNLNGDIFYAYPKEEHPAKGLRRYYKTFEHGHVFLNHDNKNPETSIGKVLFASWNPIMLRVELLESIEKDDPRGLKVLQRVERGDFPKVSMGARVPFDVCFTKGTLVYTRNGYVPIDQLSTQDKVMTLSSKITPIEGLSISRYSGLLYSIKPQGLLKIDATYNHPFFVLKKEDVRGCSGEIKGVKRRHTLVDNVCSHCNKTADWQIHQVSADQLRPNDYLLTPVVDGNVHNISNELAYLIGVYAGDGFPVKQKTGKKKDGPYRTMGFRISCGSEDNHLSYLRDIITKICGKEPKSYPERNKKALQLSMYDQKTVALLEKYAGATSGGKRLQEGIFADIQARLHYLGGYIDSDGSIDKERQFIRILTISRQLAYDTWQTCIASGIIASLSRVTFCGGYSNSSATTAYQIYIPASYSSLLRKYSKKVEALYNEDKATSYTSCKSFYWGNFLCSPISSILTKEVEDIDVYNIDVEGDDESYIAGGVAVHNCTICRNVARTREEYCSHLKTDMNKIYEDGRLVAAINDYPRFFDSSKVFVEADRSSGTLAKVAGKVIDMPEKASTIEKQVTDNQVEDKCSEEAERGREVDNLDSILPPEILDMLSNFKMPDVMGTFSDLGMKVKPQEFIYIKIKQSGGPAEKMHEKNISIEPDMSKAEKEASFVSGKNFNQKIAEIIRPYISKRTMVPGVLKARQAIHRMFKTNPKPIEYIKNAALEREYATYVKTAINIHPTAMMYTINQHPEFFNELRVDSALDKTAGIFSEKDMKDTKEALYGALHNV